MTHDELLKQIYKVHNDSSDAGQEVTKQYDGMVKFQEAVTAVVELHKPVKWRDGCPTCNSYKYPCPTIEAIEKELS